jgi:hypothetical protein
VYHVLKLREYGSVEIIYGPDPKDLLYPRDGRLAIADPGACHRGRSSNGWHSVEW